VIETEQFKTEQTNINCYVITMRQPDRMKNIETQFQKLRNETSGFEFKKRIIDAIVGKNLDLDKLISKGLLTPNIYDDNNINFNKKLINRKNEVAIYLSHLKCLEQIKQPEHNKLDISIVFEDDFILEPKFNEAIKEILNNIQHNNIKFDIIILGMLGNNGKRISDDIYEIDCPTIHSCYLSHAYIVNNHSIEKIKDAMKFIDKIVDVKIYELGKNKQINILRVDPDIVKQHTQEGTMDTVIRNN